MAKTKFQKKKLKLKTVKPKRFSKIQKQSNCVFFQKNKKSKQFKKQKSKKLLNFYKGISFIKTIYKGISFIKTIYKGFSFIKNIYKGFNKNATSFGLVH